MKRGLHPRSRQQRARGDDGDWALAGDEKVERRDVPPKRVAQAYAATLIALMLSLAGVGLLFRMIGEPEPIGAREAEARFSTAGPALTPDPRAERIAVEQSAVDELRGVREPGQSAIDRAMRQVVREGWGEPTAPSGPAQIALERAEATQ